MALHNRWRKTKSFFRFVMRRFVADECQQHAASLTYTTLFAVVPMMTVVFSILAAIPSLKHISIKVQNFIFSHFLPDTGIKIQSYLSDFSNNQASSLTIVGVFMLFITALMMLLTIEKAFNKIWKVKQPRQSIVSFLRYWAVLSLGPFLLGAAFTVSSYITSLRVLSNAEQLVGVIFPGLQVIPLVFTALAFSLLYIAVPNCQVPIKSGFQAGFFSAILFEVAKNGFTFFVGNFSSYQLIYGAFAAFPLFLLWVYFSWMIILLGVEVCRALALYKEEHQQTRHPVLAILDVLQLFYQRQQEGKTVSDIEAMQVLGKHEVETWGEFVNLLMAASYIQKTESGHYVLARSLEHIKFWDFYQILPWPLPQANDLAQSHNDDYWIRAIAARLLAVQTYSHQQLGISLAEILTESAGDLASQNGENTRVD